MPSRILATLPLVPTPAASVKWLEWHEAGDRRELTHFETNFPILMHLRWFKPGKPMQS